MKLRKMQKEFDDIINKIIAGAPIKKILVSSTPGSGKSSIPIITTKLIDAKIVQKIGWIVPRSALAVQGEHGFCDPFFRKMFNHKHEIRSSTNDPNPCRGSSGFVTTFQAIGIDKKRTVLNDVKYRPYAILLDEFHYLEEDSLWHKSIQPIIDNAKIIILMTGTLERGNGSKIAFTDYEDNMPVLNHTENTRVIRYTRKDALKEKAILPIKFNFCDAKLEWETIEGNHLKINSFKQAKSPEDIQAALFTALNSDFSKELLSKCLNDWKKYKKKNPTSKLLVVTDIKKNADKVTALLKSWGFNCKIATSHESQGAIKAIKEFKQGLDIIVTIAMAYIGLDVPEISHICCLTNIRSKPWIEQMIARGVRINKKAGPYSKQTCYVFATADKKFLKVAAEIEAEQIAALKNQAEKFDIQEKEEEWDDEGVEKIASIIPLSGEISGEKDFAIGQHNEIETISEKETRLRGDIQTHINKYCRASVADIRYINSELKQRYGKPRAELCLQDLEKLLIYIKRIYPTEVKVKGKVIEKGITPFVPKKGYEQMGIWDL